MNWSFLWELSRQGLLLRKMARDLKASLDLTEQERSIFPYTIFTDDPYGTNLGMELDPKSESAFNIKIYMKPEYDRADTIAAYTHEVGHWLLRVKNPGAMEKYTYARLRWNMYRHGPQKDPFYDLLEEDINLILFDEGNAWEEAFKMCELPCIKKLLKKGDMWYIKGLAAQAYGSYHRVAQQRLDRLSLEKTLLARL